MFGKTIRLGFPEMHIRSRDLHCLGGLGILVILLVLFFLLPSKNSEKCVLHFQSNSSNEEILEWGNYRELEAFINIWEAEKGGQFAAGELVAYTPTMPWCRPSRTNKRLLSTPCF